jgi:hypothetical protein
MRKKVKGITMIELLAAMAISALVIIAAFNALGFFSRFLFSYKSTREKLYNISLFDRFLSSDISNCSYVSVEGNIVTCSFNTKSVRYLFEDKYIVRNNTRPDTFQLEVYNLELSPMEDLDAKLIHELRFNSVFEGDSQTFHYRKDYPADVLVNFNSK